MKLDNMILLGTKFIKITIDTDGNVIKEVIPAEDLVNHTFEQIEIIEYYKRKE